MKIQRIQQQNYHSSMMTKTNRQENSVAYEGLRLRKDGFANKNCKPSFILQAGTIAGAVAIATKELLFNKVLDVSTVDQMKQDALYFGERFAEKVYLNDGEFVQEDVEKLVLAHLGKEKAKNVEFATSEEYFCKFAKEHLNIDESVAKQVYAGIGGAVFPGGTSGKLLFVLKLSGASPDKATNIVAHEFEHLLHRTSGILAKFAHNQVKIKSQKQKIDKKIADNSQVINMKILSMQTSMISHILGIEDLDVHKNVDVEPTIQGVVEMSPLVNTEEELNTKLKNYVRRALIRPNLEKSNLEELNICQIVLRDEARAYEVGGKTQKYYNSLKEGENAKTTVSEMVSVLFNRMADIIGEYKNLFAVSYFKKSMGLKYTDYYEPPKPVKEKVVKGE